MISFDQALQLTLDHTPLLEAENAALLCAVDRTTAADMAALVDSPSADVSLKDGYAIHSLDIKAAREDSPVTLSVLGTVAAGDTWQGQVCSGEAVRILSGAPIPEGADAIVAEEFTQLSGDTLLVTNDAHRGRNILPRGNDTRSGALLIRSGMQLSPPVIGLLAAAGYQAIPVVRQPKVAILATGDEVVAPGMPLLPGKLYASNLVTLGAWCSRYGFAIETFVVQDDAGLIREKLLTCIQNFDAVLTSGGAWSGERDLLVRLLDELDWEKLYHRVRIGPGKAAAFGLFEGKPVFCLPGGPPSNHMAFLQLALPGLQKMCGMPEAGLPKRMMRMAEPLSGQSDWTQFVHGRLQETGGFPVFTPLTQPSRLQMMAAADAIIKIPEGESRIEQGQVVEGQLLR